MKSFFSTLVFIFFILITGLSASPKISITEPAPFSLIYEDSAEISGRVQPALKLRINGLEIPLDKDGNFKAIIKLPCFGRNTFFFTALGWLGSTLTQELTLVRTKTFADIQNCFAKNEIEVLATLKIFGDESFQENFRLNEPLSRQVFLGWLVRTFGVKKPKRPAVTSFKDVKTESPFSPFIEYGVTCGWLKKEIYFYPEKNISRFQAVTYVLKALGLISSEKTQIAALKAGLLPEAWLKARQPLEPEKMLTRAEAAYLLAQTKPVKARWQMFLEKSAVICKEIQYSLEPAKDGQIIGFKVQIQKPLPLYNIDNPEVLVTFLKPGEKKLKLLETTQVTPADEVFYLGKTKLSRTSRTVFPFQINLLGENGTSQNFIFTNNSDVQKFNNQAKNQQLKILKITASPAKVSLKKAETFLIEVALDPRQKENVKKVYLVIKSLGRIYSAPAEDDGQLGDKTAGDSIFSLLVKPAEDIKPGEKKIFAVVEEKNGFKKFETLTINIVE